MKSIQFHLDLSDTAIELIVSFLIYDYVRQIKFWQYNPMAVSLYASNFTIIE